MYSQASEIAAADFALVGPFGFVLDKAQWLERYTTGGLKTSSLIWDEVEVRDFGQTTLLLPAGNATVARGLLAPLLTPPTNVGVLSKDEFGIVG